MADGKAARGKATESDATYIAVASRTALDRNGVGAMAYKDCRVILRLGGSGVLVAVFKDPEGTEEEEEEEEMREEEGEGEGEGEGDNAENGREEVDMEMKGREHGT